MGEDWWDFLGDFVAGFRGGQECPRSFLRGFARCEFFGTLRWAMKGAELDGATRCCWETVCPQVVGLGCFASLPCSAVLVG